MITTERLVIRPYVEEDWPAVSAFRSDPELFRYIAAEPETPEQTRQRILEAIASAAKEPRDRYQFAIVLKESGRVIGAISITILSHALREGELGYMIHRDYHGQGYATEASRAMIHYAFTELGLHRLVARCDPENPASARILEKCGMRKEAHFRECLWCKGGWRDRLVYAILDHEWKSRAEQGSVPD